MAKYLIINAYLQRLIFCRRPKNNVVLLLKATLNTTLVSTPALLLSTYMTKMLVPSPNLQPTPILLLLLSSIAFCFVTF